MNKQVTLAEVIEAAKKNGFPWNRIGRWVENERFDLVLVGPGFKEINDDCTNPDGSYRVQREQCSTCPFRPKSSFNFQLKDIVDRVKKTDTPMQCHKTFPADVLGSLCRGGFDYKFEKLLEGKTFDFQDEPVSSYVVLPVDFDLNTVIEV